MPAPPFWLTGLESRVAFEYASWRLLLPLLERLPSGDGHSVLVLPGFTAGDRSTRALRQLLRRLGYRTYGWRLGANLGPTAKIVNGLEDRVQHILNHRDEPFSIVGWSLGGIFAREIARLHPESVRQVITLGSPIRMSDGDDSAVSGLWDSLQHLHEPGTYSNMLNDQRSSPPVPTTSIYSRTDGIVHWRACLESKGPISENVEVFGSHCGLGVNASAAFVIADRLAQPRDSWSKFRSPLYLRGWYPYPANWRESQRTIGAELRL